MKIISDLIFELVDLPAEGVKIQGQIPFAELDIQDEDRFSCPNSLEFDLHLTPCQDNKVLLRGTLRAVLEIICDRCDQLAQLELSVPDVCHTYENPYLKTLDLTPDIREDILIAFPQKFLCSADCLGLCMHCGQNLNEGRCDCCGEVSDFPEEDPWGALDQLQLP